MHEMHTDPKSEANLVSQSVGQCVTLRTRRHVTDLRGINILAGRLGTSIFKLFRRPLLLACSCRVVIGTVFAVLGKF